MYEEMLKYKYLRPYPIENKEFYYKLIFEVSEMYTSKLFRGSFSHNVNINLIIDELGQLLSNAIELYEWGYFDNAYYSLRCANELATVMLDLSDKEDYRIKNNMDLFLKKQYKGRKRSKIIDWLSEEGFVFKDVLDKIPDFKKDISNLLREINQIVHINGKENLYCFRKGLNDDFHHNQFKLFKNHLLSSIRILTIFRLIIDPFPLLLDEEEIQYRCPEMITPTFSKDLLNLIGQKTLKQFKKTKSYMSFKENILTFEKRNPFGNDFIVGNYIDLNHLNEIYSQKHLFSEIKIKFLDIVSCTDKIIEIRTYDGLNWCTTSSNINNYPCIIFDDNDFINYQKFFNIKYNDIYMSILCPEEIDFTKENFSDLIYIFHIDPLENNEIKNIKKVFVS